LQKNGALIVSLDFELYWGVSDQHPLDAAERSRLQTARQVVPALLQLFDNYGIHATWATVGMLFADSRAEAESFKPALRPQYQDPKLDPYNQNLGASEEEDPYHFAPSLIAQIARTAGQEIASHSFSHYYGMEGGQELESFAADVESAVKIAAAKGYTLNSFVFPRNQVNPAYLPTLQKLGFSCYRDTERVAIKGSSNFANQQKPWKRIGRLMDSYLNIFGAQLSEAEMLQGLLCTRSSRYLRPYAPWCAAFTGQLQHRIQGQIKAAASTGKLFHLWWHPEDFALFPEDNLRVLEGVLQYFDQLRNSHKMHSWNMRELSGEFCSQH